MVSLAAGLDGAGRRAHCGPVAAGVGPPQPRVLEVPRVPSTQPEWNHKRIYRVYKAMRLNLRRAARRRLPKRERVPVYVPRLPDTAWSVDALTCGRRFRTVNVVDDFNREAMYIEVDTLINSARLVRIFEQLKCDHGLPQVLRTDNGPEFLGETFMG